MSDIISNFEVNHKRIARNTVLLYIRTLLTMIISLYTSRVILQILGVEDYGIYNVVSGFVTLMSFVSGAISTSTSRYITFALGEGDEKKLKEIFSIALLTHILIAIIIIILGETVGLWFVLNKLVIPSDRMHAALISYHMGLISTFIYIWSIPYNACIIAHEKMSAFAYISIYEACMKLLIVFLLAYIPYDRLGTYAILLFIVQLSIRIIYSMYCRNHFPETKFRFIWNGNLFKEMLSFAGWNLWGSASYAFFTQGVNVLLNMFFGPVVNSARGIAIQIQSAVTTFSSNFQTALNPQITKAYANSDLSAMRKLVCRSTKFSFCLLYCISLPIIIETEFILGLWLKAVPEYTSLFLQLMLWICIVDAMSNPLMVSAAATGKVKLYQSVIGSLLLMIVPISYLALKLGAAPEIVFHVHLVISIIATIVRLYIIRPMINLPILYYFRIGVMPCLFIILASFPPILLLKRVLPDSTEVSCMLVCVAVVVAITLSIFIGMNKTERQFIFIHLKSAIFKQNDIYTR